MLRPESGERAPRSWSVRWSGTRLLKKWACHQRSNVYHEATTTVVSELKIANGGGGVLMQRLEAGL